ncbi:MAG: hypothetical protein HQK53_06275 [Oligoflexia bacterium]|nr:hypothetical protein [Oligoflexia bacterium]
MRQLSLVILIFALFCVRSIEGIAIELFNWESINIPGAVCGDGLPYHIFVRRGDPQKLAIGLGSGGACWNFATCWGPTFATWIHPLPVMIQGGIASSDPKVSPLADYTHVFFDYCTGDVFVGAHTANYFLGSKVHHYGSINFQKGLEYILQNELVDFSQLRSLVLFGSSAGGIGAMAMVSPLADKLTEMKLKGKLSADLDKAVILDSIGLHFGKDMWKKFSPELFKDLRESFGRSGLILNYDDGDIGPSLLNFCRRFSDWRIGFLQSTKDVMMTQVFGAISLSEYNAVLMGEGGIYKQSLDPNDNCSSWIIDSYMHMFLFLDDTSFWETDGKSARDYVQGIVEGTDMRSYPLQNPLQNSTQNSLQDSLQNPLQRN